MDGWKTFSFPIGARPIFRCELLVLGRVVGGWTTPLKNISQNVIFFPRIGVKIKHVWKHHLVILPDDSDTQSVGRVSNLFCKSKILRVLQSTPWNITAKRTLVNGSYRGRVGTASLKRLDVCQEVSVILERFACRNLSFGIHGTGIFT